MSRQEIKIVKNQFEINGEPMKIISGGMHYFRIVPEYWRDRLEKLKLLGCNTVETYVAWNLHEPKKGQFCFEGICDLVAFIELAKELGLYVIVRPSPYICAEWEFGGLPGWLLEVDKMHLRSSDPKFLECVSSYYDELMPKLVPLQVTQGGPVILMQIENEYGYFADDTNYLEHLKGMMSGYGIEVPFITSDGPWGDALACGSVPGVLPTANFGSDAKKQFDVLKQHTDGPLMCMEFWVGWFDNWGAKEHQTADIEGHAKDLEDILKQGHVNIYMFCGGTNFGFMNGSNYYDQLSPDVTSYDYDALLTEDGQITEKYKAFQQVIGKFVDLPQFPLSTAIKRIEYGEIALKDKVSLWNVLDDISAPVQTMYPKSMERLGQSYGYHLYRTKLSKEKQVEKLRLYEANDRVNVWIDQTLIMSLYDVELKSEATLNPAVPCEEKTLDLLVENMGRVNFGPLLEMQRKGIDHTVTINGHQHLGWEQYPLQLESVASIDFSKEYIEKSPAFYLFEFEVEEVGDTFLEFAGFEKGCAFVNDVAIGRFWGVGPQKRLYIPGPLLKQGINEIVLFETEGISGESIWLRDEADLG